MATLHLTAATTVADLRKEFNEAFGSQVKVYIGNKGADMSSKLGDTGLSKSGDFECRSSLTVATFIERMKEDFGLKVKVYTCDEWVAVLDGLTLESSGKVKKNAVKADMESMIAYQRTEGEDAPTPQIDNTAKIEAEKAKAELDKQKAEAEAAKAELARIQAEAAKAKAEAEAAKAAAEKAKAEAAKAAESEQLVNKTDTKCPEGALNGLFSISENQKIRFSKGNLQFCPKRFEWRFADNQWDIVGADNINRRKDYEGWLDLFKFGTSGYLGCDPLSGKCEQNISNTNYDWGIYNAINNGGNNEGLWYTLGAKEWAYILAGRTNAQKLKFKATVCNVEGYVILPDDFYEHKIKLFINIDGEYINNVYSKEDWQKLECAGAVFFPKNGEVWYEGEKSEFHNENYFYYYTGTCSWKHYMSGGLGIKVLFDRNSKEVDEFSVCTHSGSVRLVQDVK